MQPAVTCCTAFQLLVKLSEHYGILPFLGVHESTFSLHISMVASLPGLCSNGPQGFEFPFSCDAPLIHPEHTDSCFVQSVGSRGGHSIPLRRPRCTGVGGPKDSCDRGGAGHGSKAALLPPGIQGSQVRLPTSPWFLGAQLNWELPSPFC